MIRGVNLYAVVFTCASVVASAETDVNLTVSQNATAVLEAHCLDCHDAETQKGEVRLDALIDMNKPAGHGADPFFFDRKPIHPPLREILRKDLGVVPVNLPKP